MKAAQDGNIVVDTKGVSLSKTVSGLTSIGTGALTATGDVTAASFKVDDKTYISSTGLNANNQKITNVEDGKLVSGSKDAVNAGQLYDVKQSIKTYVDGNGITIAGDDNKISVNTGKGLEIADDKVQVKVNGSNLTLDETNGLGLSTTLTGLESIKTGTLNATGAVTAGSFSTTNGSATIGNIIINANNGGKITGLTGGVVNENSTEAINGGQLWKVQQDIQGISDLAVTYRNKDKQAVDLSYNNGNGTTITNVAAGDISRATSMDAVNGGQLYATNQIVGDGDYSSNNFLIDSTAAGGMDLTEAASALDKAIGTLKFTGNDAVLADSYTNVTDAVSTLDRNIGSLKFTGRNVLSAEKMPSATSALDALDRAVGSVDFKETPYLGTAYTNLTSATDKLASAMSNIAGIVGIRTDASGNPMNIDWGDDHPKIDPSASVVTAIKGIDTRVMTLETAGNALSAFSRSNISTLSALSNMDVSAVNALSSLSADDLSKLSEISVASDGSGAAETSGTNTTNNSGRPDRGPGSGADDSISHDGDTVTVDNNVKVTGDTDLQGNLNVGGDATFNGNVDMNGTLNMNGNKITGVADGEISATSTDAVNGSQLWQTNQQVAANTENIGILGSAVNKLGDRIERVGAGAAALAALHPLDFDPDNKLDFAAGFGNYRGASAVAVGAFYRPSENVMFSVGGAFGGGEDMVNAGVSFKVGAGSGSATTSRTAMAKSLKSMQEVVASQDAQLAQQREQIDKLTAMVELLMEQNGQAQPKDGDAQAGQPQQ
ncbi:Adhesin yadA precursor [uncultured Ruminococcus sp.]|nr:Adhesin yadA precursor [uncultured Ruminococcus sp.]